MIVKWKNRKNQHTPSHHVTWWNNTLLFIGTTHKYNIYHHLYAGVIKNYVPPCCCWQASASLLTTFWIVLSNSRQIANKKSSSSFCCRGCWFSCWCCCPPRREWMTWLRWQLSHIKTIALAPAPASAPASPAVVLVSAADCAVSKQDKRSEVPIH